LAGPLGITLALLAVPAPAEVRALTFASPSLGREVRYALDLPASYASGEKRYPVVYALHGLFEGPGFWERRGLSTILAGLRDRGELSEFLVVVVDGGNSFFVNGPLGPYEDLVARDVVEHVDKTYRTLPGRPHRALLGVSMGGYAALRIALRDPGRFAAVATHSAMLLEGVPREGDGAGRGQMAAFHAAFGNPIDETLWTASDPLALAARAEGQGLPALSFDCGAEDRYGLAAGNLRLHEALLKKRIPHAFELPPGDHGYEYVRTRVETSLRFLDRALTRSIHEAAGSE
jgi:S-formylglutathione hydrolase FrmB